MQAGDVGRSCTSSVCHTGAIISALWIVAAVIRPVWAIEFPGPSPGTAVARLEDERLTMQNAVIAATWNLAADRFGLAEVVDRISGDAVHPRTTEAFVVALADGRLLKPSQLRRADKPTLERIQPDGGAVGQCRRFAGWRASLPMVSADGRIRVIWHATLRDESNYIQGGLTLSSTTGDIPVKELTLMRIEAPDAKVVGEVDGSPVVAGNWFFACEHPMANNRVVDGSIVCGVPRYRPIRPGQSFTVTAVIGVVPDGQLRRAFLYYIERERVRPYCPFVYYISWFDIAAPDRKMNEQLCLDRIHAFGAQLARKRGIRLDAFVFDDGWDDDKSLWRFHPGFPNGFAPLGSAAAEYNAVIGTWISPWGGYGRAKAERLEYGKKQGFETNPHGFSLAGQRYYARFRSVCTEQIQEYGVGYLKFDGVGPGNVSTGAGAEYGPDIEALLELIADLRRIRPDLFVNTTVGTWPSPYWLWYSDSIWRGGRDVGFHGPGSTRQQWLTYRDMIGYELRTRRGPLYPLNSLKFQSVICAPLSLAAELSNDPKGLVDDIHMAAGSGTQMQEFFVRPNMMTPELWDAVAEAVDWSRRNADVLVDTHAIGGDPGIGQVYGYASWSPRKGILVLRNPSDKPARFQLDVQTAFELPPGAPQRYLLEKNSWTQSEALPTLTLQAGQPHTFDLAPFEVVLFQATPTE